MAWNDLISFPVQPETEAPKGHETSLWTPTNALFLSDGRIRPNDKGRGAVNSDGTPRRTREVTVHLPALAQGESYPVDGTGIVALADLLTTLGKRGTLWDLPSIRTALLTWDRATKTPGATMDDLIEGQRVLGEGIVKMLFPLPKTTVPAVKVAPKVDDKPTARADDGKGANVPQDKPTKGKTLTSPVK